MKSRQWGPNREGSRPGNAVGPAIHTPYALPAAGWRRAPRQASRSLTLAPVRRMAPSYRRAASTTTTTVETSMMARDRAISQGAASPPATRIGMISGATGGRKVAW